MGPKSRKYTNNVDKIKANPVVNRINSISKGITKMIFQLKETPLIIANP